VCYIFNSAATIRHKAVKWSHEDIWKASRVPDSRALVGMHIGIPWSSTWILF